MRLRTDEHLAQGGDAVSRAPNGKVVFIKNAAPSELVDVRIVREDRNMMRAEVVNVVAPSAQRVAPKCPHFGVCGGCLLQHVAHGSQTRSKHEALLQGLTRIGKARLDEVAVHPPWSHASYGYRTRARVGLGWFDGAIRVTQKRHHSNDIVLLAVCPILDEHVARAAFSLAEASSNPRRAERRRHESGLTEASLLLVPPTVLVGVDDPDGRRHLTSDVGAVFMDASEEREFVDPTIGRLLVSPHAFFQSNLDGCGALVETIGAWSNIPSFCGRVLELFSGVGMWTATLMKRATSVTAVEGSPIAGRLFRRAFGQHSRVRVLEGDVFSALATSNQRRDAFDAALVDPPRAGLSPDVPEALRCLHVEALLYVSCDMGTFSRDTARLRSAGFRLTDVRLFDFYPQTPHAEVMGRFVRTNESMSTRR